MLGSTSNTLLNTWQPWYSGQTHAATTGYWNDYLNLINQSNMSGARSDVDISRFLTPAMQSLMNQNFASFAPELYGTGNQLLDINAQGQAARQNQILGGQGAQYIAMLNALNRGVNPELFSALGTSADAIKKLMGSIDVSGKLSSGEQEEISKGLTREGLQRGTVNAPSNLETVANATQWGKASRERQVQSQGILSDAIKSASSFLQNASPAATGNPTSTTAVASASGNNAPNNPGAGQFMGVTTPTNQTGNSMFSTLTGQSSNTFNNMLDIWGNMQTTDANIRANQKDWADYLTQVTGAISNISPVGGRGGGE